MNVGQMTCVARFEPPNAFSGYDQLMTASTKIITVVIADVEVKWNTATQRGTVKRFFRIPSTANGIRNVADSAASMLEIIVKYANEKKMFLSRMRIVFSKPVMIP